jgi:hypothetical protein
VTPYRSRVILCSPYAGDTERNVAYAKACMLDSISRNEAPLASHLLYTQMLDDRDHDQRAAGIDCEHSWLTVADKVVVYLDLDKGNVSSGMAKAMALADALRVPVERRHLPKFESQEGPETK